MRAFEIHTFQNGKWKIDSIFDDRELAIFEAQRMESGRRYSGIRVIEEVFDERSQEAKSRTIFSGSKADEVVTKPPPKTQPGSEAPTRKTAASERPAATKRSPKKVEKERRVSTWLLIVILVLSVIFGIGAVIVLRVLAGAS